MAFDYQDMQDTANELLQEFGGHAILYTVTPTTYSPSANPENSNDNPPAQNNVFVAVVPLEESYVDGKKYEWNDQYHGGTSVVGVDAKAYMMAVDSATGAALAPKIDDYFIMDNGDRYTIKTVSRIDPSASTNCLFVMDLAQ